MRLLARFQQVLVLRTSANLFIRTKYQLKYRTLQRWLFGPLWKLSFTLSAVLLRSKIGRLIVVNQPGDRESNKNLDHLFAPKIQYFEHVFSKTTPNFRNVLKLCPQNHETNRISQRISTTMPTTTLSERRSDYLRIYCVRNFATAIVIVAFRARLVGPSGWHC